MYHDEYVIPPPSTTTSGTESQRADGQTEPNPACRGAVCAGADWPLSTLSPTPSATDFTKKRQANWEQRSYAFHRGQQQRYEVS